MKFASSNMVASTIYSMLFMYLAQRVNGADWNYKADDKYGPERWVDQFPLCGLQAQSPIAFWKDEVKVVPTLADFDFTQYNTPVPANKLRLHNNGHTVQVDMPSDITINIQGGNLPAEPYKLAQFHFHWGLDDHTGAEHRMGATFAPLSLHMVHVRTSKLSAPEWNVREDLAVIGMVYHVDTADNPELEKIIAHLNEVSYKSEEKFIAAEMLLKNLLPTDVSNYYRYYGSLTTPPCWESVIWTVMVKTVGISARQLNIFRAMFTSAKGTTPEEKIGFNYRPIQALNGRDVSVRVAVPDLPARLTTIGATADAELDRLMESVVAGSVGYKDSVEALSVAFYSYDDTMLRSVGQRFKSMSIAAAPELHEIIKVNFTQNNTATVREQIIESIKHYTAAQIDAAAPKIIAALATSEIFRKDFSSVYSSIEKIESATFKTDMVDFIQKQKVADAYVIAQDCYSMQSEESETVTKVFTSVDSTKGAQEVKDKLIGEMNAASFTELAAVSLAADNVIKNVQIESSGDEFSKLMSSISSGSSKYAAANEELEIVFRSYDAEVFTDVGMECQRLDTTNQFGIAGIDFTSGNIDTITSAMYSSFSSLTAEKAKAASTTLASAIKAEDKVIEVFRSDLSKFYSSLTTIDEATFKSQLVTFVQSQNAANAAAIAQDCYALQSEEAQTVTTVFSEVDTKQTSEQIMTNLVSQINAASFADVAGVIQASVNVIEGTNSGSSSQRISSVMTSINSGSSKFASSSKEMEIFLKSLNQADVISVGKQLQTMDTGNALGLSAINFNGNAQTATTSLFSTVSTLSDTQVKTAATSIVTQLAGTSDGFKGLLASFFKSAKIGSTFNTEFIKFIDSLDVNNGVMYAQTLYDLEQQTKPVAVVFQPVPVGATAQTAIAQIKSDVAAAGIPKTAAVLIAASDSINNVQHGTEEEEVHELLTLMSTASASEDILMILKAYIYSVQTDDAIAHGKQLQLISERSGSGFGTIDQINFDAPGKNAVVTQLSDMMAALTTEQTKTFATSSTTYLDKMDNYDTKNELLLALKNAQTTSTTSTTETMTTQMTKYFDTLMPNVVIDVTEELIQMSSASGQDLGIVIDKSSSDVEIIEESIITQFESASTQTVLNEKLSSVTTTEVSKVKKQLDERVKTALPGILAGSETQISQSLLSIYQSLSSEFEKLYFAELCYQYQQDSGATASVFPQITTSSSFSQADSSFTSSLTSANASELKTVLTSIEQFLSVTATQVGTQLSTSIDQTMLTELVSKMESSTTVTERFGSTMGSTLNAFAGASYINDASMETFVYKAMDDWLACVGNGPNATAPGSMTETLGIDLYSRCFPDEVKAASTICPLRVSKDRFSSKSELKSYKKELKIIKKTSKKEIKAQKKAKKNKKKDLL